MKYLVLAVVLVSFAALVYSQSHNYSWGYKRPYDGLMNRTTAIQSSSMMRVKSVDLYYPVRGQLGRNITFINIMDQYSNGKGGYATIKAGGIGFNHTTIHLKTQRGNGFNFIVDIYGR